MSTTLKVNINLIKRTSLEDIEISRGMFEKAISLDSNLVDASILIGRTYMYTSDYDKAKPIFDNAVEVSKRIKNKVALSNALTSLGVVSYYRGNLDEALKIYSESNSIAKEVGDKGQIIRNLNNLSLIYIARGNQQKALEMLKEMLSMAVAIDDKMRYGLWSSKPCSGL